MPTIIRQTPSGLIPKELFTEKKIQEYWNVLCPNLFYESIRVDDLGEFYLLYPTPIDADTIHEITLMYKNIREKFPCQTATVCIDVYENNFNLLVLKDMNITFAGYFNFSVSEDIVYHLTNVAQLFFDDISQINFYYTQLSRNILSFLKKYFKMNQL
ncbi:MAG: DUF3822 family protein [Bacteroidetes bacterium]|nr:DUF3822 family protein [Bacteroidota bacterium]MCL1968108.1 DUF3822 family protein [Bacteroidota bacterium]